MLTKWRDNTFFKQPAWLTRLWLNWLNRRLPARSRMTLSHKSIFILPSGFGLVWLGLILLLYLFGTNYQNNLIIGLSLLLLSLFNTCLFYGYKNLAGLTLQRLEPPYVYAGETLSFPCQLTNSTPSHQISLYFGKNTAKHKTESITCPRVDDKPVSVSIPFYHPYRGKVTPGRITLISRFPLGLCRAWSHVDLDTSLIVFAKHEISKVQLDAHSYDANQSNEQGKTVSGVDEFKGLKQHVRGESLKQVAWKQLAQGRGMLSKEFEQPLGSPLWLTLDASQAFNVELKISQLSWQVDKLSQEGQNYGLKLNSLTIEPDNTEAHRVKCLQALAMLEPSEQSKATHHV